MPARFAVKLTVPPKATVPPPVRPDPACTVREDLASIVFVTPPLGMLIVPLLVIGPPVKPAPVATFVTVPPNPGDALVSVIVPPNATVPPPDNPDPAFTVTEGFASIVFVTPAVEMLIVPLLVIGPPAKPAPVAMLVTVPLVPGKVCPGAKVTIPFFAIDSPVALTSPGTPYSKLSEAPGFDVLFPSGVLCQRNR